ncbi:hypothetical protein ACFQAT_08675 [Undibacterium arcticum]|uniref:Uncharacterized protein n=1 Tax=Undibacterium arcticum TaxID=1762892 RepID=A0ABV7F5U8_9BURK
MNGEPEEKSLTTADLATTTEIPTAPLDVNRDLQEPVIENQNSDVKREDEQLAPLFLAEVAKDFRSRWDAVQRSFVDDPKQAVRQGDELVAQVMKSLAETFSDERAKLDAQLDQTDKASTENLRIALRRYRSFFERLLSL